MFDPAVVYRAQNASVGHGRKVCGREFACVKAIFVEHSSRSPYNAIQLLGQADLFPSATGSYRGWCTHLPNGDRVNRVGCELRRWKSDEVRMSINDQLRHGFSHVPLRNFLQQLPVSARGAGWTISSSKDASGFHTIGPAV